MELRQGHEQVPYLSAAAARIGRAVEEEPRLEALAICILDQVLAAFGAAAVALYTFDAVRQRLELLQQRGFPAPFEHDLADLALDGETISSKAAVKGEMQIADLTPPVSGAETIREQALCDDLRGLVAVPLQARSQMVGVLTFATQQPGRFSQSDAPTIEIIAHTIAASILNARGSVTSTLLIRSAPPSSAPRTSVRRPPLRRTPLSPSSTPGHSSRRSGSAPDCRPSSTAHRSASSSSKAPPGTSTPTTRPRSSLGDASCRPPVAISICHKSPGSMAARCHRMNCRRRGPCVASR